MMTNGGRYYLSAGNYITLTASRGTLFTFTLEEGVGYLRLAIVDDRPYWDFESEEPAYRLLVSVGPSSFTTPGDGTLPGS